MKETIMANYSRWDDVKKKRPAPDAVTRAGVEQDLDLGQLIYDLRTEAGLSQRGKVPSSGSGAVALAPIAGRSAWVVHLWHQVPAGARCRVSKPMRALHAAHSP